MKTLLTLIIPIVAIGMLTSCQSNTKHVVDHKDSIEYAIHVGFPDTTEQIDGEPIYVPMELLGLYQPGDSVWINRRTNILTLPLSYTEENHRVLDTSGLMKVQMAERLYHNKWIKQKDTSPFVQNPH